MAESIISRTDLGNYLRQDLDADEMALIAVNAASQIVRDKTEQALTADEDDTAIFVADGVAKAFLLPELPVTAVDEVRVDDEVTLDWRLLDNGVLVLTDCAPSAGDLVEVDYAHGYETIPDSLRIVALTIAARIYHQGIAKQESTGGASVTYSTPGSVDLTVGERMVLELNRPRRETTVAAIPEVS